jgi:urea transport system permease protein
MARWHERLTALLCALILLFVAGAPACAQSYEEALAKFTTDSYSDTDAGIAAVATSGNPLAAQLIDGAAGRAVLFSGDDKRPHPRAIGTVLDAPTGKAASGAPATLKAVHVNRLRRSIEAAPVA